MSIPTLRLLAPDASGELGAAVVRPRPVMRATRPALPLRAMTAIVATALVSPALGSPATAATEQTLFAFDGSFASKAANPDGTLLRDASGALYGATMDGDGSTSFGAVFKLTPPALGHTTWTPSFLHTFTQKGDSLRPNADLVMDRAGALYGTTEGDGAFDQGVVFKLTPGASGWTLTVLHAFNYDWVDGITDGSSPHGGVAMDSGGALYGTTCLGGSLADPSGVGFGTAFRLTPPPAGQTRWTETVLYRFAGGADGQCPQAALARDGTGALYGTTLEGGQGRCLNAGCGTVFKLAPPTPGQTRWTKTTLYRFTGGKDGGSPRGKLLLDRSGALYGTTYQGGTGACTDGLSTIGCGVVFKVTPPAAGQTGWTQSVLLNFQISNGSFPEGGVITDMSGSLYGTTGQGGQYGYGVAFRLSPPATGQTRWTETVLHNFNVSSSGSEPVGELVGDAAGHLFGVTYLGGAKLGGTAFEITP